MTTTLVNSIMKLTATTLLDQCMNCCQFFSNNELCEIPLLRLDDTKPNQFFEYLI